MTRVDEEVCALHAESFRRLDEKLDRLESGQAKLFNRMDEVVTPINRWRGAIAILLILGGWVSTLFCGYWAIKATASPGQTISLHFNSEAEAREVAAAIQQKKGKP